MKTILRLGFTSLLLTFSSLFYSGCQKGSLNLFSIQDDKDLGLQTKAQIEADPAQFPILNPSSNQAAYNYLNAMRNDILNSGVIKYKNEFDWEVYIIQKDDIVNAFCTPGGYIYVYTGLIKYLDNKSSLAGVLGHEMAHADRRHSTTQLTKIYGVHTLLSALLGDDPNLLAQIGEQLISLTFSRADEKDADTYSVNYLCPTKYRADGSADFFQKILDSGASSPPAFLSTHPSPENRVQNIKDHATEKGCSSTITSNEEDQGYTQFKALF
ncbi:MAG TPA: M48 family metalloprotease [Edaphocola sp.]|nr:M48 family metalloprotease [Edaphocola sp.]